MFKDSNAFSSFSVDDIEKAFSFYSGTLGLDVARATEGLTISFVFGGTVFIYPKPEHAPATFTVLNFQVHDIEKTVTELVAQGIMMEEYDTDMLSTDEQGIARDPAASRAMAWFKDPAGNILGIMQQPA